MTPQEELDLMSEDNDAAVYTYSVTIGALHWLLRAVNAPGAERLARIEYRRALRLPEGSPTPPAEARMVTAENPK